MMEVHSPPWSRGIRTQTPAFSEERNRAEPREVPQLSSQKKTRKPHQKQPVELPLLTAVPVQ